jgi:hygromycin-B 7''-O-kinase
MREHLLVDPSRWTLTGLFDFEPAMIGDRAYDFVAVGVFVSRGDPRLLGRIMAAYGHVFSPRELLAHTLLHVYSNLPWYFRVLPAPPEPTLDSLAEAWFGTVQRVTASAHGRRPGSWRCWLRRSPCRCRGR